MACARFTRNRQSSCSVRDAPGLICQGCARSVPLRVKHPPPGFSQVFILKVLKVACFDTLLQVFILKVVSGTGFVQRAGGLTSSGCEAGAESRAVRRFLPDRSSQTLDAAKAAALQKGRWSFQKEKFRFFGNSLHQGAFLNPTSISQD